MRIYLTFNFTSTEFHEKAMLLVIAGNLAQLLDNSRKLHVPKWEKCFCLQRIVNMDNKQNHLSGYFFTSPSSLSILLLPTVLEEQMHLTEVVYLWAS